MGSLGDRHIAYLAAIPTQPGYADVVLDYFNSGAGPIVGPYGQDGTGTVPVSLDVVLGEDDSLLNNLALPTGSSVTVGFLDETAVDGPGDDIFIREAVPGNEQADVYVSANGVDFTYLGTAVHNSTSGPYSAFDLADIGFTQPVVAVKVVGLDNNAPTGTPGFELAHVLIAPDSIGIAADPAADVWVAKNPFGNGSAANLLVNGDFEVFDVDGSFVSYGADQFSEVDRFGTHVVTPGGTLPAEFGWSLETSDPILGLDLVNSLWQGVSGTSNPDGLDQSVDLDVDARLSQSFATEVGQTYALSFWYSHNPGENDNLSSAGTVRVEGNDTLLETGLTHDILNSVGRTQFVRYGVLFTADSETTTLTFEGKAANAGYGLVLDDVSVVGV